MQKLNGYYDKNGTFFKVYSSNRCGAKKNIYWFALNKRMRSNLDSLNLVVLLLKAGKQRFEIPYDKVKQWYEEFKNEERWHLQIVKKDGRYVILKINEDITTYKVKLEKLS